MKLHVTRDTQQMIEVDILRLKNHVRITRLSSYLKGLFPIQHRDVSELRTKQTIASRVDLESGLSFLREALVHSNDVKELRVTFPARFTLLVSRVASAILIFVTILNKEKFHF